MPLIQSNYGASNQPLTCSLAPAGTGLANNSQRQSGVVDNTALRFLDALVFVRIKTGPAVSGVPSINVYAFGSADGGSTFSDGAGLADAPITLTNPPNMRLIGVLNTPAAGASYYGGPFSVASAFGGVLPDHWGIVMENKTGGALDGAESNHAKLYQGVQAQAA